MQIKTLLFISYMIIILYGCEEHSGENKKKSSTQNASSYQLTQVKQGSLSQTIKIPAQLAAYQEASIVPKINGYVKSVFVDIGTHVTKGQLLMVIEAPELDQEESHAKEIYAQAVADYDINKENYMRLVVASKTAGAISPMALASAKAKMESDSILSNSVKANWQLQQTMKDYLRVTAPFSGVITQRNTHPGSLVSAEGKDAQPMLELKQINKLRLQADIPEQIASELNQHNDVTFYLSAFPGKKMTAKVARKSNDVDVQFRSERIEMDIDNLNGELSPGMYADVVITTSGTPNAIIVPRTSVVTSTERKYVLAVREGKTVKIDVTTGNQTDSNIEVLGNLSSADKIIVNANDEIKEGVPVNNAQASK